MIALTCSEIPALVILAWLAAVGMMIVVFNVRRYRPIRVVRSISAEVKAEVVAMIDRVGWEGGSSVLLLRPTGEARSAMMSFLGGDPILPDGVTVPDRPINDGLTFLAQVRLRVPPLPPRWRDRLVLVYASESERVAAVSVQLPPGCEFAAPEDGIQRQFLDALHLPGGGGQDLLDDDGLALPPYQPSVVLNRVPELRTLLSRFPDKPERILPHIMVPGIATHEIDTFLVSLMGGDPELIQNSHDVACPRCRREMTFLFQLGDVLGLHGDAPCVYIYGCDEHQEEVAARVDMH